MTSRGSCTIFILSPVSTPIKKQLLTWVAEILSCEVDVPEFQVVREDVPPTAIILELFAVIPPQERISKIQTATPH